MGTVCNAYDVLIRADSHGIGADYLLNSPHACN